MQFLTNNNEDLSGFDPNILKNQQNSLHQNPKIIQWISEGFRNWGYPQIINFNVFFVFMIKKIHALQSSMEQSLAHAAESWWTRARVKTSGRGEKSGISWWFIRTLPKKWPEIWRCPWENHRTQWGFSIAFFEYWRSGFGSLLIREMWNDLEIK